MTFTVTYENETTAENPLQAVLNCLDTLKQANSGGRCFTVTDSKGNTYSVDLDDEDNEVLLLNCKK